MFGEIRELAFRWKWTGRADRLGPDMISTYLKFYIPSLQKKICNDKFNYFGPNAEFRLGAFAVNCSNISLGQNVVIRPQTILMATPGAGSITIEDDVLVGSGVHVYTSNHSFIDLTTPIFYQGHTPSEPVLIKKGAWIGANAIILPGVTIGNNSVVGAGSIVTKSVDDFVVVAGNPARVIKQLN